MRLIYLIIIIWCAINVTGHHGAALLFAAVSAIAIVAHAAYRFSTEDHDKLDREWKQYVEKEQKNRKGCYGWVTKK